MAVVGDGMVVAESSAGDVVDIVVDVVDVGILVAFAMVVAVG